MVGKNRMIQHYIYIYIYITLQHHTLLKNIQHHALIIDARCAIAQATPNDTRVSNKAHSTCCVLVASQLNATLDNDTTRAP